MKKFKNLMLMLALALLFVGAMGITKASADDGGAGATSPSPSPSAAPAAAKIEAAPQYDIEVIEVTCDEQVYYQVVKAADQKTNLKPANWIKAAKQDNKYYIDFSATANGKDAYFALTTDNTKGDAAEVAVVDSVIKSIKVGLNYKTEEITKGLADVITTLNVKGVDPADDKPEGTAADYQLQWKRGANGTWADAANFTQLQWDMLKASNGTLYIAIDGTMKDGKDDVSFRLSKEAKVKIPKSAKAPTVKVDFVKGTVALKNGMQIQIEGNSEWMDVIAYDKSAEDKGVFAKATDNLKTNKKVSSVLIGDLIAAIVDPKLLGTNVADGSDVSLLVRTAATDKKFPSMIGNLKFKAPAQNIAAVEGAAFTYTKADKENDVEAEFIINFASIQQGGIAAGKFDAYEYILADKAEDKVDFAKQKWTKCPADGKLDLSSKIGKTYTCVLEGGTKVTPKYEDTSVIYFRKAAVKADAKKDIEGVFASKTTIAAVTITEKVPEVKTYAITATADGTATVKVDGTAADKAKEKAAVTVAYTVSADTKEVKEVKISYKLEGATEATEKVLELKDGVYSFEMPAAAVTITVTEQDKAAAGA